MTTRTKSEAGKASREKGKRGEREAAKALMDRIPGTEIRRSVQYSGRGAAHTQDGGMADLVGLQGYHLEVKRTEKAKLYEWMDQVDTDKQPGEMGLILHRQSGKKWIAIMDIDDVCRLINAAKLHIQGDES